MWCQRATTDIGEKPQCEAFSPVDIHKKNEGFRNRFHCDFHLEQSSPSSTVFLSYFDLSADLPCNSAVAAENGCDTEGTCSGFKL
jgi:hypothetical protein